MNQKVLYNKEKNEKKILQMIYKPKKYISIMKREEPDFELVLPSKATFGVEITEFFLSESNARLKYIPTYFNEIMDKKSYRHKDDRTNLDVKDITIQYKDGTFFKNVEGLFLSYHSTKIIV
jgi:hypothetical protein